MTNNILNLKNILIFISIWLTGLAAASSAKVAIFIFVASIITVRLLDKDFSKAKMTLPIWTFFTASVAMLLMNAEVGGIPTTESPTLALLNILICLSVILTFMLITKTPAQGISCGVVLLLLISTLDRYVYVLRGNELMPSDIQAIQTAVNVSEDYSLLPDAYILLAWTFAIQFLVITKKLNFKPVNKKKTLATLIGVILSVIILFPVITKDVVSAQWRNIGTIKNGCIVNFLLKIRESRMEVPNGYDTESLRVTLDKYEDETLKEYPNIIVIVNESFADFTQIGDLNTNMKVLPFYESLNENTQKGYVYSSIYGGETPKSEYEFLTGNSLVLLPRGLNPFMVTVDDKTYSVVSELRSRGYYAIGMHPFQKNGWNRENVYPDLGFDKSLFEEDFPNSKRIGSLISDKSMYDKIISEYKQSQKPVFIYGMTMQNHGPYTKDNRPDTIKLKNIDCPEAEQYLSLAHESDKAIKYLIDYFKDTDEKTVIVFFGDHQPALPESFYDELHGGKITNQQLMQKVPYFIWTNYDIKEQRKNTSINYLSNDMYEIAGFMPKYNQFLEDIQDTIPIINQIGYYSEKNGRFQNLKEADETEKRAIEKYRNFVYNANFDDTKIPERK